MKKKNQESPGPDHIDARPLLSAMGVNVDLLPEKEGVYLVGGTVRDLLLGKTPADCDIVVSRPPEVFAGETAARCGSRVVPMGRPGKISFRVPAGKSFLDITGLQGSTIRRDLHRRDFTINAMAVELASGRLLDITGGRQDLSSREIRMVSDGAFRDDPIRRLRAFRLAAALEFSVEAGTLSALRRDAGDIRRSAGERIRSELYQLMCCRDASPMVALMTNSGLLSEIFQTPSILSPGQDHFPDRFRHLEEVLNHPPAVFSPGTPDPGPWLKFAMLMLRHCPHASEEEAKSAIGAANRRLRLSAREKSIVMGIARHRTRPWQLYEADRRDALLPVEIIRFFMDTGPLAPHLLMYALANAPDDTGETPRQGETPFAGFTHRLLRRYYETFLPVKALPPLVTGRDLSTRFSLPPSPLFKKILDRIEEARLSGEITRREPALALAEKLMGEFKS